MLQRLPIPSFVLACLCLLPSAASAQSTRYVEDNAAPGGDGQSWSTAYQFLQDALTDASSNAMVTEIRIAGGTYRPDRDAAHPTTHNGLDSFVMRNNLAIRGGYAGMALPGTPDVRDLGLYTTTFTVGLPAILADSVNRTAVLEGCRLTGSRRGVRSINASPTIRDCLIEGNSVHAGDAGLSGAGRGGGVSCEGGAPLFVRCTIRDNQTLANPALHIILDTENGGGVNVDASSAAVFVNCII